MRLVSAALKLIDPKFREGFLIIPCVRHGEGYHILHSFNYSPKKVIEGFVDAHNNFYTRKDAINEVWNDLSSSTKELKIKEGSVTELYSEDLY